MFWLLQKCNGRKFQQGLTEENLFKNSLKNHPTVTKQIEIGVQTYKKTLTSFPRDKERNHSSYPWCGIFITLSTCINFVFFQMV